METELSNWLKHAYREGLKVHNAEVRRHYSVEAIVKGKKISFSFSPRRFYATLMAMF